MATEWLPVQLGPDDFTMDIKGDQMLALDLTAGGMAKLAAAGYTRLMPINLSVTQDGGRIRVTVTPRVDP